MDETSRDGGAAFPIATIDGFSQEGMSLRDWFAGHTLVIMMTRHGIASPDDAARASYRMADAMIAARQEGGNVMTKADALIELREKVKSGERISFDDTDSLCAQLIDGSTLEDAGKFRQAMEPRGLHDTHWLHETVLPTWSWSLKTLSNGMHQAWTDERYGLRRPGHVAAHSNPARAWLLAILDALIEQEKSDADQ